MDCLQGFCRHVIGGASAYMLVCFVPLKTAKTPRAVCGVFMLWGVPPPPPPSQGHYSAEHACMSCLESAPATPAGMMGEMATKLAQRRNTDGTAPKPRVKAPPPVTRRNTAALAKKPESSQSPSVSSPVAGSADPVTKAELQQFKTELLDEIKLQFEAMKADFLRALKMEITSHVSTEA
eukprot:TRINITY_DN11044_c0_g1_i10.p4 TRINITY_DN11044_c0_g1~~TRINITY_DN11044_c0_g1_i10.p4  ORF type:complete len:179 (+),score=7.65 TRINITY_DN11044_c0_g1_i10:900-1436(+)